MVIDMRIGKIITWEITGVIEKIQIIGVYILFSEKETFFLSLGFS